MKENKLIAEFMGFTLEKNIGWYDNNMMMPQNVYDTQNGNCFDELLFDNSWDWLMPVVERIEQVIQGVPQQMLHLSLYSTIDEVYQAVVEFIKEYNKDYKTCDRCCFDIVDDDGDIMEHICIDDKLY